MGSTLYGIEGRSPGPSHSAGPLSGNFHCLQPPKGSVLALEVETQDYWTLLGWNSLDQASVHPAGCA